MRSKQNLAAYEILATYDKCLNRLKQQRRVVTFSDISERLAAWMKSLVEKNAENKSNEPLPEMESIAHRMDSPIDHLLLDEFQDTSPAQWQILKPFAEAIVANQSRSKRRTSFFCVGDTKQAIYAWRGVFPKSLNPSENKSRTSETKNYPKATVALQSSCNSSTKLFAASPNILTI
jgi:ATP-dependent exoDNAse (exonuclease V) beta subunit